MNDLPLFQQVMEDGYVKQQGVYAELMESGTAFEKLVSAHKSSITALDDSSQQSQVQEQNVTDENTSGQPSAKYISDIDSVSAKGQPSATQLTEQEEKEIGDLGWKPYKGLHQCVQGNHTSLCDGCYSGALHILPDDGHILAGSGCPDERQ